MSEPLREALELLPCPFCNSLDLTLTVNRWGWKIVECDDCGMTGPCIDLEGDKYLDRWNTRSALASPSGGGEYDDEDMAAVGRALMEALEQARNSDPWMKTWAPLQCPSEIVFDLLNRIADVQAHSADRRDAPVAWQYRMLDDLGFPNNWFVVDGPLDEFKRDMADERYELRPLYAHPVAPPSVARGEETIPRAAWLELLELCNKLKEEKFNTPAGQKIQEYALEIERLTALVEEGITRVKEACDLLAERTYGSPARSPGHNARLRLEGWTALSSTDSPSGGEA